MKNLREQLDRYAQHGQGGRFIPELADEDIAALKKHAPRTFAWRNGSGPDSLADALRFDTLRLVQASSRHGGLSAEGAEMRDLLEQWCVAEQSRERRQEELDREAERFFRGRPGRGTFEGWVDAAGNPVRVLLPSESIANPRDEVADALELGTWLRAVAGGTRNPTIRASLSEGTSSAGGALVPERLAEQVIDKMRARAVLLRAGARTVVMDSQTLALARVTGDPTATWAAEQANISDTGMTFDRVTLTAKTLRAWVKASREVWEDAVNLGEVVRNAFAAGMAVEVDRAGLVGSGTGAEPFGIGAASGAAPIVSMGTNGAALADYDPVVDCVTALGNANAESPSAMIMAPRTQGTLAKLADTTGQPLRAPELVAEIPRLTTTGVPVNQTQGTANNASSIILGNFAELLLGVRTNLQVIFAPGVYLSTNEVAMLFVLRADVAWAHAESFVQLRGIIP